MSRIDLNVDIWPHAKLRGTLAGARFSENSRPDAEYGV